VSERLQKWLANKGLGSRREIERWIEAGRVSVDGNVASLGAKVDGTERILVDGKPVRVPERPVRKRTIMYHKPPGEICTRSDPQGRKTIFHSLPRVLGARWISVGRLDFQTSGLLILTTDGELANRLMHPSSQLQREYVVRALGEPSEQQLAQLTRGVELEDGPAKFDSLLITDGEGANKSYLVKVSEGRNRIVRRLFEQAGCRVNRLMRVSFGPLALPRDLRAGQHRELTKGELEQLLQSIKGDAI
jgi:23S rRNA pseudouridine2605 synthase